MPVPDTGTFETWLTSTMHASVAPGGGGHTGGFDNWFTSTMRLPWFVDKAYIQTLSGGMTPVGVLIKKPGISISGSVTPTGNLVKSVWINLVGVITSVGTLVNVLIPLGGVVLPPLFKGMFRSMFRKVR